MKKAKVAVARKMAVLLHGSTELPSMGKGEDSLNRYYLRRLSRLPKADRDIPAGTAVAATSVKRNRYEHPIWRSYAR
ncbi:hypothetical protein [Mesorhizobium sp. M4A.F.Ca.ET.050.02.1.1]|uniref:hypothetical protein n=1 Tax=Mesorhizobium sp. M4A.F.Ca.ET.050.02.1.1 TaxID=2496754 RepID=UPI001FE0F644|nr:hypothetical protein [Mesorhizobium sp. M4A.F.Ca.ET.050.02.1.1]